MRSGLLCVLLLSAASPTFAQSADLPPDKDGDVDVTLREPKKPLVTYASDPFAKMDKVFAKAAGNEKAQAELKHALGRLDELRRLDRTLDPESALVVRNSNLDEEGTFNVRFRQTYAGVPVKDGGYITHRLRDGSYDEDSDFLKRGIRMSPTPAVPLERALSVVEAARTHLLPYAWQPRGELQIHPVYQNLLDDTGRPAPRSEVDLTAPDVAPGINAERVPRTVAGYRLVWRIETLEGVEHGFGPTNELESLVDANTGELFFQGPLSSDAIGPGTGPHVGTINLRTTEVDPGEFQMIDANRNYSTWDDDFDDDEGANLDFDNTWGSLTPFPFGGGDTGTKAVRQGAMVDVHHNSRVFWDLQKNVFNRSGLDNDFAETNNYVHNDFMLDNAAYHWWTGNIVYGDKQRIQSIDVVAHEHGHGFEHETNGLGGDTSESIADIWGALGKIYLTSGSFAVQSSKLPDSIAHDTSSGTSNPFVLLAGRDMVKPSRKSGTPDNYFPDIGDVEIHQRGGPSNRAFYFLSQGASCQMGDPDFSLNLPWGMAGVGPHKAGRIITHAMVNDLPDGPDYMDLRVGMITAAKHIFTSNSPEANAARNAYAGVNVGSLAGNYPASPPLIMATEPHDNIKSPQFVARPSSKDKPAGCPDKVTVMGTGTDEDWFRVQIPAGKTLTVGLLPFFTSAQVNLEDAGTATHASGTAANFTLTVVPFTAVGTGTRNVTIQVKPTASNLPVMYELFINWE